MTRAAAEVATSVDTDPRLSRVTDVLFARGGQVVAHHTWRRSNSADRYDLFSVTKTILAVLTGIAAENGLVALSQPVTTAPRLKQFPQLQDVTVWHLLTMTRGAEIDGAFDLDEIAVSGRNWATQFALAPPLDSPGARFGYDNGASQLLAELLHHVVGDLRSYAENQLFSPLGFDPWEWSGDPTGVPCGAAHLSVSATSLAEVGLLLCRGGRTRTGRRLLPGDWVEAMRSAVTGGGLPESRPYGMGVWVEDNEAFFGAGWGGQMLLCRPRDEVVVVTMSDTGFTYGPPARDEMPVDWASPLDVIRAVLG